LLVGRSRALHAPHARSRVREHGAVHRGQAAAQPSGPAATVLGRERLMADHVRRTNGKPSTSQVSSAVATAKTADLSALRRSLEERGVKFCLASYVDVHGIPKAKAVPIDHFERMMRGSELFTGAAIDGLGQGPGDDELAVYPDSAAVTVLPWR